jgi:hypothetical protein
VHANSKPHLADLMPVTVAVGGAEFFGCRQAPEKNRPVSGVFGLHARAFTGAFPLLVRVASSQGQTESALQTPKISGFFGNPEINLRLIINFHLPLTNQ